MKMKHVVMAMVAALMVLTSAASFADEKKRVPLPRNRADNPQGMEGVVVQHRAPERERGGVGIIGQLAGIDTIHRKYQLKIQRVFLDAKQEALDYFEMQQDLRERLFDLTSDYESEPERNRSEIIDLLEELMENQSTLQEIQERSMEKIQALHEQEKKEIEKAMDAEITKLREDREEMERFVEILRERRPFEHLRSGPQRGM